MAEKARQKEGVSKRATLVRPLRWRLVDRKSEFRLHIQAGRGKNLEEGSGGEEADDWG